MKYRHFKSISWWRRTWVVAFTLAVIALPFLSAELVFWSTGSIERSERALRGTMDRIGDVALMWIVLELFVVTKLSSLRRSLEEEAK